MFRSRQEVDKHVSNSLKKLNNETERNLRSFAFAKLYFNVGDYEHAVRYANSYLSVKPKSAEGYNLLGKSLEKLGKKQAALEAFRTSLQLDSKQNNLVLKVCELLAQDDLVMDTSAARYFCDLAQTVDSQNPIVSSLKERLITNNSRDPNEISQFLLKELENRPTDVNLRVRLLKCLLEGNKVKEAYKHAYDIEQKKLHIFDDNIAWYETFAEVLVRYQKDASIATQLTWEFWFLSTSILEKLAMLSLNEHIESVKTTTDYVNAVFNFDQSFLKASQSVDLCPDKLLLKEFLNHYEGQLNLHFSVLALKQAKKDLMSFKEVENVILPLLFTAYNIAVPDTQGVWFNNLPENRRLLVAGWHKAAAFRCSQAGNVLIGLSKDRRNILIEKANQHCTGMWREHLFKKLFVKRDHQLRINTSFFNSSSLEPIIKLPDYRDLISYNEIAQSVYPSSLHHYIWLALTYQNLSDFTLKSFDGLQYSIKNLSNCAAETLNILDVQSFIYCAALCAQSKIKNADQSLTYFTQNRPAVLPVSITGTLGTLNQSKFLTSAYKMYKNEYTANMGEIRLILIKGIEVVRCVGNHGLDVKLLVTLATIFADRINKLTKHSEIEANSARAELYWKTALPLLEKLKNEHAVVYPNNRLFEYKHNKDLTQAEILSYIDKAKLFIGVQLMKKEEYEKAMQIFEELKDPYASFYQSQIYKAMADSKTNLTKENVTSEMRSQNIILLSRARDCLYLTLDRLREPSQDKNHPLNAQLGTEIEKTERLLSRIDPDCNNRNECDGMSDENVSDDSVGEQYLSTYTHHASFQNARELNSSKNDTLRMYSTPLRLNASRREEARPSPERLDAQIRQLAASRDIAVNNILDQMKMMVNMQQGLSDELRGFKDSVKGNYDEVKKVVDDLSHSVDDRLQSVTDMVQEMRRELNDIKREQHKNAQISVEDLYDLDPEYNSLDYNLGASLNSNLPSNQPNLNSMASNMFPNYPRLPQAPLAANLAAYGGQALYPGLYPGLPFPYGPSLPPAPGLPFLPPQADQQHLSQLSNLQGLPQNLYQSLNNPHLSQLTNQVQSIQTQARESPKSSVFPSSAKDTPKAPVFTGSGFGSLQSGFLGQNISSASSSFLTQNVVSTAAPSFLTQGNVSSSANAPSGQSVPSSRAPPVNVVITSSDPLPSFKNVTVSQPVLSVTIPPQFIKGSVPKPVVAQSVHDYQIPMPANGAANTTPSVLSQPPPFVSTQGLLSSVITSPAVSSLDFGGAKNLGTSPNVSLGIHIEKTLDKTFDTPRKPELSLGLNKSNVSNISGASIDEYDPRPDFQPIIPLPDEVPVTTGEEKETELFCQRAKLFRFALNGDSGEWKERGIGNIKILYNPESGKVRVLMRREQVHKICANHFLTKDMVLTPLANNDRALVWAANDFADEKVVLEKFCIRFKSAEEAKQFEQAFELAKTKIGEVKVTSAKIAATTAGQSNPANLGGFKFVSAPTFKPKEEAKPPVEVQEVVKEPEKASPFAGFSFGSKAFGTPAKNLFQNLSADSSKFSPQTVSSQNNSKNDTPQKDGGNADDFVPTQEFKPLLEKLPDLVEVRTGEENAEVLFDERSKLFRLDTSGEKAEWKERGVGNLKILKEDTLRLVMRRDQVHKVCLNHQILKSMTFKKNNADAKAVLWHAQDFSEGVLKPETFSARFKSEDIANQFLSTVQKLQTTLDENSQVTSGKHHKAEPPHKTGFADKFKPAKGSWECKNCYIINDGKVTSCLACDTSKTGTSPKKAQPTFAFSAKPSPDSSTTEVTVTPLTSTWGSQFKPAAGSWECKSCYVSNAADKAKCMSCETPKEGSAVTTEPGSSLKGIDLDTGGLKFSFGMPPSTQTKPQQQAQKFSFAVPPPAVAKPDGNAVLSGFGDGFKPKAGSWECKICYVRNEPSSLYCLSCDAPKDDNVPKKEAAEPKGVNLETPGLKFSFGMPPATTSPAPSATFAFGSSAKPSFPWMLTVSEGAESGDKNKTADGEVVSFGSPKKIDFEFKPRSPRKISTGHGDESDASYVEEEEANVYFKPVVPLPDIVEVKTGEENEEVLYSHRAKLFRFVDGEWKERGLGDVKILKDTNTGKRRVVMRREQVLKICLNHWLTRDVEYLPKDEKTWLFHAADFSEGELSHDKFCLRFKNGEVAQEFKKSVDDALAAGGSFEESPKEAKTTEKETDSDVEFVSETKVSPEEEQEAIRLKLPPKFMAYRQKPDCECDQCKKDDEYLKDLFGKTKSTLTVRPLSNTSSVFGTPIAPSFGTPSSGDSVYASPTASSFTFGTTPTSEPSRLRAPKTDTLRELLQKSALSQQVTPGDKSPAVAWTKSGNVTPSQVSAATAPKTDQSMPVTASTGFAFNNSLQKSTAGIFSQKPENIFKTMGGTTNSNSNSPSFFGGASTNLFSTPKEGGNASLFGAKPVLGNAADTPQEGANANVFGSKSVFGSVVKEPVFGSKSIFGAGEDTPKESGASIFGSKPVFGGASVDTGSKPFGSGANLFATTVTSSQQGGNIFAPSRSSNSSIFGASTESNGSIFGGASTPTSTAPTNIFSTPAQGNIFGNKSGNIFSQTLFGNKAEPKVTDANLTFGTTTTTNLKETDEVVLQGDSNLSFANLAKAAPKEDTSFAAKSTSESPFAFLGAGAPVFGKSTVKKGDSTPKSKEDLNETKEGSDNEEGEAGGEHDPHFEPIVPLPDQIVVTTGEEDEKEIFNERAKLFRFDSATKEWKERGVGQFKVLFHPENKTYRLLLRREQVHKVVLNQRITSDLELQPMSTSDKAWIWAGMNYSEDETKLEQLAVKFKNSELAQAFRVCIEDTVQKVAENLANRSQHSDFVPTSVQDAIENVSNDGNVSYEVEHYHDEYNEDDDEDEDDDDDDDDRSIMFSKRCTLSEQIDAAWQQLCMGELQVYYDPELYAARITIVSDNGEVISNTVIGVNTVMEKNGKECWWKGVEWASNTEPQWRVLKATFSSVAAAEEFFSNYQEGISYAQEVGFVDEEPQEIDAESDPLDEH